MAMRLLILVSFMVSDTVCVVTEVNTTSGKVQGVVELSSIYDKYVQKFLNIPYAEPPVGNLRLSRPKPKKYLNETINNNNISLACWQELRYNDYPGVVLTEDCLILNIWTPYPPKQNRDVMVWIHGGGYRWGFANAYPGHNLVAVGNVILATINYRLSMLGFPRTERFTGNLGLFDQRLAMNWIKENIVSFGGNPQSITIFGESAGAACVSAHTLSKGSWPYFSRSIIQSGEIIAPWAITPDVASKKGFHMFFKAFNCSDNNQLLQCLQENVTEEILKRVYLSDKRIIDGWSSPYVDGDFLTDDPIQLLRAGNVKHDSVMMGITKDEGLIFLDHLLFKNASKADFLKAFFNFAYSLFPNASQDVYDKAVELYEADRKFESPNDGIRPLINLKTDVWMSCPAELSSTLRLEVSNSTLYQYLYSYASPVKMTRPFLLYRNGTFGFAAHGVDMVSVFGFPVNNTTYPVEDQILSMRMILYWTNFAKNGNPNVGTTKLPVVMKNVSDLPYWPKYTNFKYLELSTTPHTGVVKRSRKKFCDFLNDPEQFLVQPTPSTSCSGQCSSTTNGGAAKYWNVFVLVSGLLLFMNCNSFYQGTVL